MSTVSQSETASSLYPPNVGLSWQRCANAYLTSLYNRGEKPPYIRLCRQVLVIFFTQLGEKSPARVTGEDIAQLATSDKGRGIVVEFYRFASTHLPSAEYTPSPESLDLPPVQPRAQQERAKKQTLPALIDGNPTPWMECLAHYIRHIYSKSQSMGSADLYYGTLKRFLRVHPDPAMVTRRDIDNFINQVCESGPRAGKQPKVETRNGRLAVLSSFFKFAASFIPAGQDEPIFQKHNPAAGIYHGKTERVHRALSEEELAQLFAAIPDTVQGLRNRAFLLTALLTTRRRAELLRLRWGDISRGLVHGENGTSHQGYMFSYTSKGNGLQRFKTELPALAYRAIETYLVASGRMDTIEPHDAIFVAVETAYGRISAPGEPITGTTMLRTLKKYARAAGLDPQRVMIHGFRHTAIQQRLKAGQQPIEIMRITGHKSMDSFYKYCNRLMGEADPGASAIEQKFSFLAK
jgi:integrase